MPLSCIRFEATSEIKNVNLLKSSRLNAAPGTGAASATTKCRIQGLFFLLVFFIVASVGAALILVVLIFLFCRARNKQTRHEKKVRSYSNGKIKEDIYKAVDTSEFPFQLREVTGQTSSNIFKREHLTNNVVSILMYC